MAQRELRLTPKQEAFCREYLIDLNATQAAIRAGYSKASADKIGAQLLGKTRIRDAISAAQSDRASRTEIDADRVMKEISHAAFFDIGDVLDFTADDGTARLKPVNTIPASARRAIASVKVRRYVEKGAGDGEARQVEVTELKFCDKLSALEKLGKHLGLFPNRHEVTGKGGGPIEQKHEHGVTDDLQPYLAVVAKLAAGSLGAPPEVVPRNDTSESLAEGVASDKATG